MTYKDFDDEQLIKDITEQRQKAIMEESIIKAYQNEEIFPGLFKPSVFNIHKYCEEHNSYNIAPFVSLNWGGELNELSRLKMSSMPIEESNH